MKFFTTILAVSVLMVNFIGTAFASHVLIADGVPLQKALCDINGCKRIPLSEKNQQTFKMQIFKEGKKYMWGSRDNRELTKSSKDDFYNFVAPGGEGYVRITTEEGKTLYVEHLTLGFKNVTYWGVVKYFNKQ